MIRALVDATFVYNKFWLLETLINIKLARDI